MAGLVAKRNELVADLKATQAHERWIQQTLENIEVTLDLFREGGTIRRHYKKVPFQYAESGSVLTHVTRMLRSSNGPVTAAEMTDAWITQNGLIHSHGTFVILRKRIGARLTKLRKEGVIRPVQMDGPYCGWEFVS